MIDQSKRRKLWDLSNFTCSIIGTCLTIKELGKIVKPYWKAEMPSNDYKLHSWAVQSSSKKGLVAKAIHKYLDRKYHVSIKKVMNASIAELPDLWADAVKRGKVSGPYWAICTRGDVPDKLFEKVFGEVHMMSHILGSERRVAISEVDQLRQREIELRDGNKQCQKRIECLKRKLECVRDDIKKVFLEKELLYQQKKALELQVEALQSRQGLLQMKKEYSRLLDSYNALEHQKNCVVRKNKALRAFLEKKYENWDRELLGSEDKSDCICGKGGSCDGHCWKGEGCNLLPEGIRKVLFIGGVEKLEEHYRQVVESFGGELIYHDGNTNASWSELKELIGRSDLVLCPVSCVSHNACLCVKKECKQSGKPHSFLRSAGVSAISKALMEMDDRTQGQIC